MQLRPLRPPSTVSAVDPGHIGTDVPSGDAEREEPGKLLAATMSIVILIVVAMPVLENWRDRPRDDFPLSYYPMFAVDRPDQQRVTFLVGLDSRGGHRRLSYRYVGQGGMNQVRQQMSKLVNRGEAAKLCETAAARVARAGGGLRDVRSVQVITGTFRMSDYFAGRTAPASESLRASCAVRRG